MDVEISVSASRKPEEMTEPRPDKPLLSKDLFANIPDWNAAPATSSNSRIGQIVNRKSSAKSKLSTTASNSWIDPSPKIKRYSEVTKTAEVTQKIAQQQNPQPPYILDTLWDGIDRNAVYYQEIVQQQVTPEAFFRLPPISNTPVVYQPQQPRPYFIPDGQHPQQHDNNLTFRPYSASNDYYRSHQDLSSPERDLNYRRYGLEDYQRQLKHYYPQLNKLGGLGPDMDSAAYMERLQKSIKIKEYASKVRENNLTRPSNGTAPSLRQKPSELKEREMAAWRRKRVCFFSDTKWQITIYLDA
jgi:hypothetical protein